MKYTVSEIKDCKFEQGRPARLVCRGIQGTVSVTFFSLEQILVRYDFDAIKPSSAVEESYKILAGEPEAAEIEFNCMENDEFFTVECRKGSDLVVLSVCKENSNITVERNGKRIHGGELGTKDTVLPRNQFRLFTVEENARTGKGYFFFPLAKADRFFGLGDKSGDLNRRMRRFRMYNRDSLGYDAENSDPLYKSIPFFIKQNPESGVLCGLYFPLSLIDSFDFGKESPFYFSTEVSDGPMAYYILSGNDYKQIIQAYCGVTGLPALPPLFSFGFFGSSMNYAEPDNAQQRIEKYFDDIEAHDIPCEGMYVSSGYLKADDGKRYAFVWNKRKFPDYGAFLDGLGKRGYNLIMNIKPGILTTHPWYQELYDKGYFVKGSDGKPCVVFYWGGNASFIDFANPEAFDWWKGKLKEVFLSHSNCGIWNDNNELELEDPQADSFKTRTLFPMRMCKASYEAATELKSDLRPWLTTRSGYAGIQKYSRTWSGDNVSDWKTLRFNQFQGWSLGLSAMPFYGHDLGGFFGEVPGMELLVRSCQSAVFQPRFVIHSWRENGEPTEAWTYPEALPMIRHFVYEHYRFMPYTYNCALEASKKGTPIDRPLFLEYPEDKKVPVDSVHCMYGPSILKILIVDEGEEKTECYLPENSCWYDVQNEKLYNGGKTEFFNIPLDSYEYLAKVPSIIPTAPGINTLKDGFFKTVEFLLFPEKDGGKIEYTYFEDSGRSVLKNEKYNLWKLELTFNKTEKIGTVQIIQNFAGAKDKLDGRKFSLKLPKGFVFENGKDVISVDVKAASEKNQTLSFSGSY